MDNQLYEDVLNYLQTGALPNEFPSTQSNFVRTAGQYQVNHGGFLTRNGNPVVSEDNQAAIFEALHDHSGRTACWARIRER